MAVALLTREDVADYAPALAVLGLAALALPVTETAPPDDPDALARALASAGAGTLIAVASPRAAAALAAALREAGIPTATSDEVWAIGPATARALAAAGIAARTPEHAATAATLAAAIASVHLDGLAGRRVILPRAEDGRPELAAGLRAAGADVTEVVAYRTVARSPADPQLAGGLAALRAGRVALCVYFAPSQVAALTAMADVRAVPACAIGETTAAALRAAGVAVVVAAAEPTPAGIAQAAAAVYPPRR